MVKMGVHPLASGMKNTKVRAFVDEGSAESGWAQSGSKNQLIRQQLQGQIQCRDCKIGCLDDSHDEDLQ